jgi:uncharacterized protein YcbK (DUF882 family)
MKFLACLTAVMLSIAGLLAIPAQPALAQGVQAQNGSGAKGSKKTKGRIAKGHKKKRKKKKGRFSGRNVDNATLRTEPLPHPSGEVWVYAENFREELRVNIYGDEGKLDEASLASLDSVFRCKRSGETRAIDPRLYEVLSIIYDHYGKQRIDLISGFRFQKNEGSRHYHGSAMDIYVPGVSIRELYEFAGTLDTGGMGIGIYPRAGFVHVDFRAPGEPSYRWTDYSPPEGSRRRGKRSHARRPTS